MFHRRLTTVLALAGTLGVVPLALGATLHVPGDYPAIQIAINLASPGDEIIVAPGTYFEVLDFAGKSLGVRSSAGADLTVINALGRATSVVRFTSGEGADTRLEGFTITGGDTDRGGGVRIEGSSPTIVDCLITGNEASQGGGLYSDLGDPTLTRCVINDNAGGAGAGLYITDGNATVMSCEIAGNTSVSAGGFRGARTSSRFVDCIFRDNTATGGGGGAVFTSFQPGPTFERTLFEGNEALGGADSHGGAVWAWGCSVTLSNCVLLDNFGQGNGGALVAWEGASVAASSCTFVGNESGGGGGGGAVYTRGNSTTRVENSIVWANTPNQLNGASTATHSDVQDGFAGAGNIDVDPLFVDAGAGDLRVAPGSPAIDAGDTRVIPGEYPVDFDGLGRVVQDPDTPDTGVAMIGLAVDMGAFELQVEPAPNTCPNDLDGSGARDFGDILEILADWGPCPE